MAGELNGRRVAILAADGVERVELEQPRQALEDAGARTDVVSITSGEIAGAQPRPRGRRHLRASTGWSARRRSTSTTRCCCRAARSTRTSCGWNPPR